MTQTLQSNVESSALPATDSSSTLYLDYAAQALRWSYHAKSEDRKRLFLDLAHIWAQAATQPGAGS